MPEDTKNNKSDDLEITLKDVASKLDISEPTVKKYLKHLFPVVLHMRHVIADYPAQCFHFVIIVLRVNPVMQFFCRNIVCNKNNLLV